MLPAAILLCAVLFAFATLPIKRRRGVKSGARIVAVLIFAGMFALLASDSAQARRHLFRRNAPASRSVSRPAPVRNLTSKVWNRTRPSSLTAAVGGCSVCTQAQGCDCGCEDCTCNSSSQADRIANSILRPANSFRCRDCNGNGRICTRGSGCKRCDNCAGDGWVSDSDVGRWMDEANAENKRAAAKKPEAAPRFEQPRE